jgi:hypothetical protein
LVDAPTQDYEVSFTIDGISNSSQSSKPEPHELVAGTSNSTQLRASAVNWKDDNALFRIGLHEWPSLSDFKHSHARCATPHLGSEEMKESNDIVKAHLASKNATPGGVRRALQSISIPVYWWCFEDYPFGRCLTSIVDDQMAVLNAAYSRAGISFYLVSA